MITHGRVCAILRDAKHAQHEADVEKKREKSPPPAFVTPQRKRRRVDEDESALEKDAVNIDDMQTSGASSKKWREDH
jgi:hypothetical protein